MKHERVRQVLMAAMGIAVAMTTACKYRGHANGEVSRNWTPPQEQEYLGVPAADAQAAIQRRLAAGAPAPLTGDEWSHVKKLYSGFNQSLLWVDAKGIHQPRVAALLTALANADSEAFSLDAYPSPR